MRKTILALIYLFTLLPVLAVADSWQAESDAKQKAVIELFTSEGCGLCPAADRWVHQLADNGVTNEQVVVLGFHIDYLNVQKGWVDKFAKPLFSERQRQLANLNLYQTVFTPEFFMSGEVIHNWRDHGIDAIEFINNFDSEADIKLHASKSAQQLNINTHVDVKGDANRQYAKLYLAVTEDNIISEIRGGDNIGAIFNHQNLVRRWLGPFDLNANGQTQVNTQLELAEDWKQQDLKLVAIVQNLYDGYILQGLSMPLTE